MLGDSVATLLLGSVSDTPTVGDALHPRRILVFVIATFVTQEVHILPSAAIFTFPRFEFATLRHLGFPAASQVGLPRGLNLPFLVTKSSITRFEPVDRVGEPLFLIFSEPFSVSGSIVRHFTSQCGEQYVQVVLAQMIERFSTDPTTFRPFAFAAETEECVGKFLRPILQNTDGQLLASEIKTIIALIHEAGTAAQTTSNAPHEHGAEHVTIRAIGEFFFGKLVNPALTSPLAQGLILTDLDPVQAQNLNCVAAVLRAIFTGDVSLLALPSSPFAKFSQADLKELQRYAAGQIDQVRDCMKGFIFSDLLTGAGSSGSAADDTRHDDLSALGDVSVPRFAGDDQDTHGLGLHIASKVNLTGHNPKLLVALTKALNPYATAIHGALAMHWGGKRRSGGAARELQTHATTVSGAADGAAKKGGPASPTAAPARPDLEATLQQLTHEVLDLRQQLQQAREEAARVQSVAARIHAAATLSSGSPRRKKGVRFPSSTGLPTSGSSSTSGDDDSDSDDSDGARSPTNRFSTPSRSKNKARGQPSSPKAGAVNPLTHVSTSSAANRIRNGLSPAEQDYRRAILETLPNRAGGPAVPMASQVFGCPLDTYVLGKGSLLPLPSGGKHHENNANPDFDDDL